MPRGGYTTDRNNIAPRVGFAWAAGERSVLRGGYGIAFDQSALAPNEFLYFNQPYFDLSVYFTVPQLYTLTLTDPFPDDFPLPLPKSATAVQRDLETGYLHQWNLTFERRLTDRRTLSTTYVGSLGRHLVAARDINQPAPSPESPNLRPNPFFADILMIESRARSRFHAVEIGLDQTLSRGMSFHAAYTIGQSMDDASSFFTSSGDANFPMDSNNPEAEWGRSDFDVRHRFTFAGSFALPFGPDRKLAADRHRRGDPRRLGRSRRRRGAVRPAVHGVPASGHRQQQHRPRQPRLRRQRSAERRRHGDGGESHAPSSGSTRPRSRCRTSGRSGTSERNSLDGPGFANLNLAFARKIPMSRGAFQVRLEIFNLFNSTNFGLPDNFFLSPTFGQILSAGAPRRMQLGVKYVF